MKKISIGGIAISLAFFGLVSISASAQTAAENAKVEKMSAYIAGVANKVGGPRKVGVKNVTKNWPENPEVKTVAAYGPSKRIGALMKLIELEKTNEDKALPNINNNPDQLAVSLITRLFALSKLATLIGSTSNDVIVKDYLDGEIADLKLIFDRKVQISQYLQSRKMREDKYLMLLGQDKDVLTEYFALEKDGVMQVLANKTMTLSLLEACYQNIDMCAKLAGK